MALPELILASTSRYRRELLDRLGIPYRAIAPACDEESLKKAALKDPAQSAPRALAERLALAKAESLVAAHPDAVIVGSDQVAELDGAILGKPGTPERALAQLRAMSGKEHRLLTAMAVLQGGRRWTHTDVAILRMRRLDDLALTRYIARDQPLDCAGSYKLERGGVGLFERIDCADHAAITGLPLLALTRILAEIGYAVP